MEVLYLPFPPLQNWEKLRHAYQHHKQARKGKRSKTSHALAVSEPN